LTDDKNNKRGNDMKVMKSTVSALTVALLMGGTAQAQVGISGGASASVGASAGAGSGSVGAGSSAQTSADESITSDAVEGTRNVLNKAGDVGASVIGKASDAAAATADAIGNAGANVIFGVETAIEAGTTSVISTDGVLIGEISGVRMVDGGQMVTIDLDDRVGFEAEKISVKSDYLMKGNGEINLSMSAAELNALINASGSSG
jgi:hypothetical protein